jgi:hypothetical protein
MVFGGGISRGGKVARGKRKHSRLDFRLFSSCYVWIFSADVWLKYDFTSSKDKFSLSPPSTCHSDFFFFNASLDMTTFQYLADRLENQVLFCLNKKL